MEDIAAKLNDMGISFASIENEIEPPRVLLENAILFSINAYLQENSWYKIGETKYVKDEEGFLFKENTERFDLPSINVEIHLFGTDEVCVTVQSSCTTRIIPYTVSFN